MIWILGSLVYGIVGFVVAMRAASMLAWYFYGAYKRQYPSLAEKFRYPSGEQWTGAIAVCLLVMPLWPLLLVIFALRGQLFRPPSHIREKQQAERIRELERELDIR